jgi:hypothetical protein
MPVDGEIIVAGDYRYTSSDEVTNFLGSLNEAVYGDVDADGTLDAGAKDQSIRTAEGRVDLHTGGPYTFTDDTAGEVAADVFNAWAYKLTAYEIAAKRGFANLDQGAFEKLRDEVLAEMAMFKADPMPGAEGPDPEDDETPPAGTFRFVPINRGTNCTTDEYSSGY